MNSITDNNCLFMVKNIGKTFRNGYRITYSGEMKIKKGCFTFITGVSGIGKSTLLHILGLLDKPEKMGNDSFLNYFPTQDSNPIDYFDLFKNKWVVFNHSTGRAKIRRSDFGFLPQDGHLLNTFSIRENLELVLRFRHEPCSKSPGTDQELQDILKSVGFIKDENIWGRRNFSPLNLSGGQRQRLALARAIVCDCQPKVIFVDEPTTYMNEELVKLTVNLLVERVLANKCSIILVTHDYEKLSMYLNENLKAKRENSIIADTYSLMLESVENQTSYVSIIHGMPDENSICRL